jgi:transketolase
MGLPTIYVFTHDSIGLGEDGPTHQPIEQLAALRAIPGVLDLRPADAAETGAAWRLAIEHRDGPTFLALTRQKLPALEGDGGRGDEAGYEQVRRGAYVLADAPTGLSSLGEAADAAPAVVIIASGSEVHIALEARALLAESGIPARVVSMPSWHLFAAQEKAYRDRVLPNGALLVSAEAASTFGWERWVGADGIRIGIDHFGASAPAERLFEEFGITGTAVAERVTAALAAGEGNR